jgi:antitoxin (DNA-binding transcriptional repressor) of toxin-antitoxin stability system
MTTYSTTEAPAKLGEILGKVRDGETIVLLQEGEAVAEIRPVTSSEEAIVRRLEEEGILSPSGERPRDFAPLAERPGPVPGIPPLSVAYVDSSCLVVIAF